MKKEAPPQRGRLSLILQIIHCFSCRLYSLFLILFYGFFFFRLKVNLIEFEFRFGHGSGRSVYSPSEYVQQIDDRYGVETFVDDNRFRCIGRRFGFDDRFVESASDFGRVGESDIGVFAAVDRKGRFLCDVAVEGHFGFRSAKNGGAGGHQKR